MAKFLKLLNSEASPWQIAIAITLGLIVGLTPFWRLHNLLILLIVLMLRINLSGFIVSVSFFSLIGWIFGGLFDKVGSELLSNPDLATFWSSLFNLPLGLLSQLNHSITLGSLLISLLLTPVCLLLSKQLVIQYRERFMRWVHKLKIMQVFKASKVYRLYQALGD
nr:TIGR03546 family protein [Neptunicella marina]